MGKSRRDFSRRWGCRKIARVAWPIVGHHSVSPDLFRGDGARLAVRCPPARFAFFAGFERKIFCDDAVTNWVRT